MAKHWVSWTILIMNIRQCKDSRWKLTSQAIPKPEKMVFYVQCLPIRLNGNNAITYSLVWLYIIGPIFALQLRSIYVQAGCLTEQVCTTICLNASCPQWMPKKLMIIKNNPILPFWYSYYYYSLLHNNWLKLTLHFLTRHNEPLLFSPFLSLTSLSFWQPSTPTSQPGKPPLD